MGKLDLIGNVENTAYWFLQSGKESTIDGSNYLCVAIVLKASLCIWSFTVFFLDSVKQNIVFIYVLCS